LSGLIFIYTISILRIFSLSPMRFMKQLIQKFLYILILTTFAFGAISAQDATPSPTPTPMVEAEQKVDDKQNVQPENLKDVPQIAPNYESEDRSLPDLGLVGVDMMQQKPLSLKEAITLALENNKDIEVSRQSVRLAELDLTAGEGFYEPRFSGNTQYERATIPNVSIFSTNKTTTNSSIVGNARYQGFIKNSERFTRRNLIIRESEPTIRFRF
jgi:hypothetical protein